MPSGAELPAEEPREQFDTGLLLALPELADFTARWRATSYAPDQPDLAMERRFPPHVTVLTPWVDPGDGEALERLRRVAASHAPLTLRFSRAETFPGSTVVWLFPEPEQELRSLLLDVHEQFPDHPPYDGEHDDPVPHLTVSTDGGQQVLAEVRAALAEQGPLVVTVDRISVYARGEDDVWRLLTDVRLGAA